MGMKSQEVGFHFHFTKVYDSHEHGFAWQLECDSLISLRGMQYQYEAKKYIDK